MMGESRSSLGMNDYNMENHFQIFGILKGDIPDETR